MPALVLILLTLEEEDECLHWCLFFLPWRKKMSACAGAYSSYLGGRRRVPALVLILLPFVTVMVVMVVVVSNIATSRHSQGV